MLIKSKKFVLIVTKKVISLKNVLFQKNATSAIKLDTGLKIVQETNITDKKKMAKISWSLKFVLTVKNKVIMLINVHYHKDVTIVNNKAIIQETALE